MEICDFSSIMAVIRNYISSDRIQNQVDFLYLLYAGFLDDDASIDFDFDNALVCRWMNGTARVSPKITSFYLEPEHQTMLLRDVANNVLPILYDSGMAMEKLYELVIQDSGISEKQKQFLTSNYPCSNEREEAIFLTRLLCFAMERQFIKRDNATRQLLSSGGLSPMLSDFIVNADVPKPCRFFCGREAELAALHEALERKGKLFLSGIAGIGKSELAKAYAKTYKKEYTNTLYLTYSGNLKQDITDLDFMDDTPGEKEEERFRRHNRFLRTLKPDTLLIVDNFNVTATQDRFLSVMLGYRCRILFTTRSRLEHYASIVLSEISESEALLNLMGQYFSEAKDHKTVLEQIVEAVHSHTLAIELAARLLGKGLTTPQELLHKLQTERTALDAADKIGITKDGKASKETYYGHIRTLFSLYLLEDTQQDLMRNLKLFPITGVSVRRTADWLNLRHLNDLEELVETGFVTPEPGHLICLHPMVQEIAIADLKPSVTQCKTLLSNLQEICLAHGIDISYYKQLFQTVENVMLFIENDDPAFYLRFLEDVFPYMEKYQYHQGMEQIVAELEFQIKNYGSNRDQALLLDYRAAMQEKPRKAIQYEQEALALIPEITVDNALLVSNLHSNLGKYYSQTKEYVLSKEQLETAIHILEQYQPYPQHDYIAQIMNYAILLVNTHQQEQGYSALQKLRQLLNRNDMRHSSDYAAVLETMGTIRLSQGRISDGTELMQQALAIYEDIYSPEPEYIEQKKREIMQAYASAGVNIGFQLKNGMFSEL